MEISISPASVVFSSWLLLLRETVVLPLYLLLLLLLCLLFVYLFSMLLSALCVTRLLLPWLLLIWTLLRLLLPTSWGLLLQFEWQACILKQSAAMLQLVVRLFLVYVVSV